MNVWLYKKKSERWKLRLKDLKKRSKTKGKRSEKAYD